MELWNLVFIQYNRNDAGELEELEAKHVDTGAGLERVASVIQGVRSNYDTDLFRQLIEFVEGHAGKRYGVKEADDLAFRVIADHSRALSFLVSDGVLPSNEGRGYVLRRVLRRAARHAKQLGFDQPFLWKVTEAVVAVMGTAFPEIKPRRERIEQVIRAEEERFGETLDKGLTLLEQERDALQARGQRVLPGEIAFKLYDTYGFPVDMTEDILRSDGIAVDQEGFAACMEDQRSRGREARKSSRMQTELLSDALTRITERSHFIGDRIAVAESRIIALHAHGGPQNEVREGDEIHLVTAETPFYAESGGQVGDQGIIETARGDLIEIVDTQKARADLTVHIGRVVRGAVHTGDTVTLRIDGARRDATRLNHSATHILHAVLRDHLGTEVRQAGSLVEPGRLRFDFSFNGPVTDDVLLRIEDDVNAHIRENDEVLAREMPYDEAIKAGALAFFGDKYGDVVRVIRIGKYSTELCGGTHVSRAGDIGLFKLRSEGGVAAGVRRIEAMTGSGALLWVREREHTLREVGSLVRGSDEEVAERVARLVAQQKDLEKQLKQLQSKLAGSQSGDLMARARQVNGMTVLATDVADLDDAALRELSDRLRQQIGSGVVVLGTTRGDRVVLLAAVTKDLTDRVRAGDIIKKIAPLIGGGGGGKPEMAQAGGREPGKLKEALETVYQIVR